MLPPDAAPVTVAGVLEGPRLERREARRLLARVTGLSETALLAHPERVLEPSLLARYRAQQARRCAGEPFAYLCGSREFYGLPIAVGPAVLVPRSETEQLVDCALEVLPVESRARVLDLGTGSGAVALAIKAQCVLAQIVGTDLSRAALRVARANGLRLGLEIDWRGGSWFGAVPGERFDLIVSNPPYVAIDDPHLEALGHEPALALLAGPDGLDALRAIIVQARAHLLPGGTLLLEHGWDQGSQVQELLLSAGFVDVSTWNDLAGHARVTGGRSIDPYGAGR